MTVLGGGAFGTAMAQVCARNGSKVKIWAREPEVIESINQRHTNEMFLSGVSLSHNITATSDVLEALQNTEIVYLVVPTQFLRSVMVKHRADLPIGVPLLCCTKGIERSTLLTPYEILIEELPGKYHNHLAVLSGPSFAKEVALGQPTSVLVASKNPGVSEMVGVFSSVFR